MNKDLDDTLKTIAANAKAMREAGVTGRVVANGVEFELAPDAAPLVAQQMPEVPPPDPLNDAVTFGTDGVPQRRRPSNHAAARSEFEKE
jgi:hypothetical protein